MVRTFLTLDASLEDDKDSGTLELPQPGESFSLYNKDPMKARYDSTKALDTESRNGVSMTLDESPSIYKNREFAPGTALT